MTYIYKKNPKHDAKSRYEGIRRIFADLPAYSLTSPPNPHEKQLVETQSLIFHKQTKQLLLKKDFKSLDEKKCFVCERVAQKLWTNFCVQGHDTPMLRYLQSRLINEYDENLQFYYPSTQKELIIMKQEEDHIQPVSRAEQFHLVDKAWQVSQEIVWSHVD